MAYDFNILRQGKTEQFKQVALRLARLSCEVEEMAHLLDDSADNCDGCGAARFRNWPQRQLRVRVMGAVERLREIADVFARRANDAEFLGMTLPIDGPKVAS